MLDNNNNNEKDNGNYNYNEKEKIHDTPTTTILPKTNIRQVPNRDWVLHVQKDWKPIRVSNLILRFPWHTDDDVQSVLSLNENKDNNNNNMNTIMGDKEQQQQVADIHQLYLQGGTAFGTGEHPTTRLCLEWIQQIAAAQQQQQQANQQTHVLDYGTGSGILGLAACTMMPHCQVVGVDIDANAVDAAQQNAILNNYQNRMQSYAVALDGTCNDDIIMSPPKSFDFCVSNILAEPLIALAPTLASMIRPGGQMGLSGILGMKRANLVMEAYRHYFNNVKVSNQMGEWFLVTGTRK